MSSDPRRVPVVRRAAAAAAAAGLALGLLAGCTTEDAPPASDAASGTPSAGASGTPAPGAGYTAPPLVSTPVDLDCGDLVDADALSSIWPGLVAATPPATSGLDDALAPVAEADGTLCSWTDDAGETMTVGVARYDDASLTSIANGLVASSNSVPTYVVEGYFELHDDVGVARALPSPYLVVAESEAFPEPGAAEPLVAAVVDGLTPEG